MHAAPQTLATLFDAYKGDVASARLDFEQLPDLHPVFKSIALSALQRKSERAEAPLLGELFPHLVGASFTLPDAERRRLAVAWLALYSYISLVDYDLDKTGRLGPRDALASSALLGWGLTVLAQVTADTALAAPFFKNVQLAFAAQYDDLQRRADFSYDREGTDVDKNRAIVAAVCAYCAAGNGDARLVSAVEHLLGAFQFLDDLLDLEEDYLEDNNTFLLRMASPSVEKTSSSDELYAAVFSHPSFTPKLDSVAHAIEQSMMMLKPSVDTGLMAFTRTLHSQVSSLKDHVMEYQSGRPHRTVRELRGEVREIFCHS
jgi:hypothetical protein